MIFLLQDLLQKDQEEHRSHHKFDSLCGKGERISDERSQAGTENPIEVIQEGNKEHKVVFMNPFRDGCAVVNSESFVTHSEDEVFL